MPEYSWTAIDPSGREKRGRIEAEDSARALTRLKSEGLLPVSLKEQGILTRDLNFSIGRKVKPRDLSVFCRQFVSISQAGVPMKEALQMLEEQTENRWLKKAIHETLLRVEQGNALAESMASQPDVFPPMLISMVEAGESSGSLDSSFARMAVHFEKEAKLKSIVRRASIYPIILVCACIGVIAVMLLYVIPIFVDMFADLDVEMPALTTGVMNLSSWAGSHWYVIALVAVLLIVAYRLIYRTDGGRHRIDYLKMRAPIFGKLTVKTACAEFTRTMSTLLSAGIATTSCLETAAGVVRNILFADALLHARDEVMKGVPLAEPLQTAGIFPPMIYHMTDIGEETGTLEEMQEKLADYYDEEVENTTRAVLAAMEPLIILFMGLIVGTLVIAVIAPIGALYEGLENL